MHLKAATKESSATRITEITDNEELPVAELENVTTVFVTHYPKRGAILDLGCGQGRDAIALARIGYSVTGIDHSVIGIGQMNQIGKDENLDLVGQVGDIYTFDSFDRFDIVLLDSMFHFARKIIKVALPVVPAPFFPISQELFTTSPLI